MDGDEPGARWDEAVASVALQVAVDAWAECQTPSGRLRWRAGPVRPSADRSRCPLAGRWPSLLGVAMVAGWVAAGLELVRAWGLGPRALLACTAIAMLTAVPVLRLLAPELFWRLQPSARLGQFFVAHAWLAAGALQLVVRTRPQLDWVDQHRDRLLADVESRVDELDRMLLGARWMSGPQRRAVDGVCRVLARDVAVLIVASQAAVGPDAGEPHPEFDAAQSAEDSCNALRALAPGFGQTAAPFTSR